MKVNAIINSRPLTIKSPGNTNINPPLPPTNTLAMKSSLVIPTPVPF